METLSDNTSPLSGFKTLIGTLIAVLGLAWAVQVTAPVHASAMMSTNYCTDTQEAYTWAMANEYYGLALDLANNAKYRGCSLH
jgi:hypothetical protein